MQSYIWISSEKVKIVKRSNLAEAPNSVWNWLAYIFQHGQNFTVYAKKEKPATSETKKLRQISMTVLKCCFINKYYSCNTITPRLRQWTEVRKVDKKKSEMASKQETTGVSRSREIISFFLYKNSVKCFQCALKNIFFSSFVRPTPSCRIAWMCIRLCPECVL